jgi:hypothetical protein
MMTRELIVLVKSQDITVRKERYNRFYGHCCIPNEIAHTVRDLSPEEEKTLARIQEFAKHKNLALRILSVSDLRVRLKYRLRKNATTPLVVCGKRVFRGVPSMRDLSQLVNEAY